MHQNDTLPVCPACGRKMQVEGAAFCPYCGAALPHDKTQLPKGAAQALSEADKLSDPVKKRALLLQAERDYPDCLEIAEALLFLGRLHERSSRALDYSVIKCYLWQLFLTPEDFSDERKQAMRTEFFHHPQLERCQQLAPDADAYTRRYLKRLACEFISLFLKGSSHYTRSFFGFRFDNRMSRVLAHPAAQILAAIRQDLQLEAHERLMLSEAFYSAFLTETGGEPQWIDEALQKLDCPVPGPQ